MTVKSVLVIGAGLMGGGIAQVCAQTKVRAGHLGRKTGKGWYESNPDGSKKESS